jgi:hypothetical protein
VSEHKELYYRDNATTHLAQGAKWFLTIIGIPIGALYLVLASIEFTLAASHWCAGLYARLSS